MYSDILIKLGLTQNEAKIYETLLKYGETAVGKIATNADINRRNVYDSLARLIEKGLVFEIRKGKENIYQAVDPKKLMESIQEKEVALQKILPDLTDMYINIPHTEDVFIYRGIEGWKNYMRDILRVGEDVYTIGGKGAWTDKKIDAFFKQFLIQAETKKINFTILFDHEVKEANHEILKAVESKHKFLPKSSSTPAAIDIFGDYVVILSNTTIGAIDENTSFTVIKNKNIATAFKTWFNLLWELSSSTKK